MAGAVPALRGMEHLQRKLDRARAVPLPDRPLDQAGLVESYDLLDRICAALPDATIGMSVGFTGPRTAVPAIAPAVLTAALLDYLRANYVAYYGLVHEGPFNALLAEGGGRLPGWQGPAPPAGAMHGSMLTSAGRLDGGFVHPCPLFWCCRGGAPTCAPPAAHY